MVELRFLILLITLSTANLTVPHKHAVPIKTIVRKIEFQKPLDGYIHSGFGYRRHPMGGNQRYHKGIDIPAKYGTYIQAIESGKVLKISRDLERGLFIIIEHSSEYKSHYFHLSRSNIKEGQTINKGDIIGRVGTSGSSTGPHLHLEIHRNNKPIDPGFLYEEES